MQEDQKSFPFFLSPATHKGNASALLVEKDCLFAKRTGDACVVASVGEFVQEVGLAASDSALWGMGRPQPQRGPRKLQGGIMHFVPTEVPLADLTAENVGQLLPCASLKNFVMLFELKHNGSQIEPVNGTNAAVLVTRKKLAIPCLRVLRVGVMVS